MPLTVSFRHIHDTDIDSPGTCKKSAEQVFLPQKHNDGNRNNITTLIKGSLNLVTGSGHGSLIWLVDAVMQMEYLTTAIFLSVLGACRGRGGGWFGLILLKLRNSTNFSVVLSLFSPFLVSLRLAICIYAIFLLHILYGHSHNAYLKETSECECVICLYVCLTAVPMLRTLQWDALKLFEMQVSEAALQTAPSPSQIMTVSVWMCL